MTSVVDHLMNLIRIPSTSSLSNKLVIEYADAVLRRAEWTCLLQSYSDENGIEKFNLIAAPPGQDATRPQVELAFVCHTDTVPPAADWHTALQPFERDGTVYGCGACDVKGFLACLLAAASDTPKQTFRPEVRFVLSADEEIGCLGAQRVRDEGRLRPRTVVIGEPTSLHVARGGKGYCLGEMIIQGAEAHSAHPKQGSSAIYGAARVIRAIEQLAADLEREVNPFFEPPYTTLNIGTIHGGTAKNIVPGECRFLVEWRPIPGASAQLVVQSIERILQEPKRDDPTLAITFNVLRHQQGFETRADARVVTELEQLTGRRATSIPFGSEAGVFSSEADEIVVFGPGDMRTAHSSRECVSVSELYEAVGCLATLMRQVPVL